ncbi:LysR substrate-binding domain-containing protein [Maricurvus nonylphenolicus]|uniref:LysR substrate-binding domain-containing protein n=1 Tax=Maricurvus nonylphenolicus TaxID=1008307 RepID=UPI0036F266FA
MKRKIPPLALLESFEATVRLGSLTRAAEELHLTQGAISQHIRKLEQFLEQPLFRRQGQRLIPNDATTRYCEQIRAILNNAEEATHNLTNRESLSGNLTVSAPTTFTACWLMPRLPHFCSEYPGIKLHLLNRDPEQTRDSDLIDLILKYQPISGNPNDATVFQETIVPVCSAAYLTQQQKPSSPNDLLSWNILHQTHSPGGASDTWLRAIGVEAPDEMMGFRFDRQVFAINAARDGLGVTFVPEIFVRDDLASGTLIKPIEHPVKSLVELVLSQPSYKLPTSRSETFKAWILEQTIKERKE